MTGPSAPLPANPNPGFAPDFYRAIVYPAHPSNIISGSNTPKGFCLHTPEEPWDNNESTPAYFAGANRDASTHYYVDSDGDVFQLVDETRPAIANGVIGKPYPPWANPGISLNRQTLSVEIEGFASSIQHTLIPYGSQFNSLVELVADRCKAWGIPLDRSHVFGHYEVANNRSDPGAGFPWADLMTALTAVQPPLPEDEMASQQSMWVGPEQAQQYVIVGRGLDGQLFNKIFSAGSWTEWNPLPGGACKGDPTLAKRLLFTSVGQAQPLLDVLAVLEDNSMGHWWWNGDSWGFEDLGGGFMS